MKVILGPRRFDYDRMSSFRTCMCITYIAVASTFCGSFTAQAANQALEADEFLDTYCSRCHNDERMSGNWSLSMVQAESVAKGHDLGSWEKILSMITRGEMPPVNKPQPSASEHKEFSSWLQTSLDNYSIENPNPGRSTIRRLNRAEYSNAVRDLLALDVDIKDELPADDSGYGFDNIADVLTVSPTLMERYIRVAGKISKLAVGLGPNEPFSTIYTLPKDGSIMNQGIPSYNHRMGDHLPLNSRGGGEFSYYAPHDGTYKIGGYLNANTNNEVDRLLENYVSIEVPLNAGPHHIGMTFRKRLALDETVQTLHNTTDIVVLPTLPPTSMTLDFVVDGARAGSVDVPSYYMTPRFAQVNFLRDVLEMNIDGPFNASGPGKTPSRDKIFSCLPEAASTEDECAEEIIANLMQQAYRRPVNKNDTQPLYAIYKEVKNDADFNHGIATAIQALLVSPSFLFLFEQDPENSKLGTVHPISDIEFASRLALFLWSSLPDDELLAAANKGVLRQPKILKQQVNRMLNDNRAIALTENFAGQWLYLRNLEYQRPDVFEFPEFDVPLRQAMLDESEWFFADIVRNNASLLNFIRSDYTFINERLARHYNIENVSGPAMRKVELSPSDGRGGLLGQGSILTVTSYGNHTSAVKRGKWILDNLLAASPPPPPPNIPALVAKQGGKELNAREQMALHREDPACAGCHSKMDPLGLSLENFDAVGAYRQYDTDRIIDSSAVMPDGTQFEALSGLQDILLQQKDQFTQAFTQRLLTYALGRGLEPYDQPKVRAIAKAVADDNYRIHTLILAIVNSEPFNLRRTPDA